MPKRSSLNLAQETAKNISSEFAKLAENILGYDRPDMPKHIMERTKVVLVVTCLFIFVIYHLRVRDVAGVAKWFGYLSIIFTLFFFIFFDVKHR